MDVEKLLRQRAEVVDAELSRLALEIKPRELGKAVAYALSTRGKRIRPAIVTLACESVGGRVEDACSAAASIELLHSSSLILDDVIDRSEKRRGMDTLHKVWGRDLALLTIEILVALSLKVVERHPRLVRAISNSLFWMGEGEAMELVDFARDRETYLELAFRKTGSLFGSAAEAGSIVGGGSESEIHHLTCFGQRLGIAFQIRDDILDCISKEEDLGKPVRQDLFMGRPSIVILDALNNNIPLERMMRCNNGELMDLVSDSISNAEEEAHRQIEAAKAHLDVLSNSRAKTALKELCNYVIQRTR